MATETQATMATGRTNATAKRDLRCRWCHVVVRQGERCFMRKERALSYKHARDAGTMYPWAYYCPKCAPSTKEA